MCKIIVMANQKGGVAKTSSTRNLAYSLAELGKKVLAVDFDPQTNLTISFGVAPAVLQETAASLMMKLVMDEALPEKGSYILNIGKVELLPSKKTLTVAEVNLLIERKDDCLAKLLAPLRADYDYILVDTGPSLGSLTINAFTAADEIIIPIDPELFALVGLKELTETISKIKQNLNPKVEIIGILFTKCSKRTTLYRQTSEQVRSVFGHLPIFESQIPATVQVGTANSKGLSVMELDAKSPAAAAYMNLAKEVLAYAYEKFVDHLLNEDEFKQYQRIYTEKCEAITAAISKRQEELDAIVRAGSPQGEWIAHFKSFRHVDVMERKILVKIIDRIYVYEGNRIEIIFKYQNEYRAAVAYIEQYMERQAAQAALTVKEAV